MAKRSSVTSYIKNLGKSLGYAAYDAIGDYTPVTKGIIEATKTTFQEAKASMKDIASSGSEKAKSFTSDVLANTLDDLKTGNWYNKKRMDGDMFGDFDFDDDFGDFEDWGDEDGTDTDASTDIITANDDANTRKVISSMGKVSGNLSKSIGYASARNAEYIVAHTRASNAALYNLNAKGFNQVSNILLNMDNTMAGIAKISQPLSNFMENSFTFYTNTTDSLNKINESLDKLVERTAMLDPKVKKDRSVKGSYGSIFAGGSFDASAYADMVKDNIKEISEMAKGIGSMISMMSGGMSGKNTLSLTSMILKGGLQLMMPGMTKESLKQFDKALSNAIGRGFRQMSKNASGSIIGDLLNSLFGLKNDFSTSVKTSNYEKGPVPWDGVARKALVEVIPTYLAKLNAILGGDEKYYDYEEGKFVTVQDIRKKREDLITNAALAAGGDFRSDMMKSVRGNKELESQFDNFFRSAFLNGKDFNLDKLSVDDIVQIFGISKKAATHLKNAYQAQGYNDKGFNKNKNNYHNFLNDIHVNRSDLNDRFANMAGTDNIIVRLSDGSIAEIKDSGKKKGTHAVLGSASERLAEKYNGNMSVAIGLVIPEYLEAIFGALNDGQSFRYNYNTGKFVPVDETKRNARRTRTTRGGSRVNAASAEATPVGKVNEDGTTEVSLGGLTVDLNETQLANYNNLATDAQKIDYLKKVARDNQTAKLRKAAEEKVAGTGFGAKLKNAFGKVTSIGEIPGAAASMALNSITNWLNSLFMGDKQNKKPGIFKKMGDFFGNYTFNGYTSSKRQSVYSRALNKLVSGLPEGTVDVIREQLEDGGYVYYALTNDGEKHTVDNNAAERFYEKHGLLIRKKRAEEGIRLGELPRGTQDIIREVTENGEEIWFAIKYDHNGNVQKIGSVSPETAEKFFGRKKGFWRATKDAFRSIGNKIKTSLFGEGKFSDNLRSYMADAKANMESGSGSGLIIAGGASGQEEEKKNKFGTATKVVGDAAATAANAIKKLFVSLTAGAENDKEKVFDGIKDGLKKIGDAKGAIGVGAITGAGVSLLTGAVIGPLGGAAIGAAAGLVAKSTKLQDILFGEGDPESEEYKEGILGALGKAIKGDKKGAIGTGIGAAAGGIVGQFVMGSPIVGAIVGAAGGFVTQSKTAQNFLFGENNEKALGQLKEKITKKFPSLLVGAGVGALIGPFGGLLPNMLVGSAMGYLTTTKKFQTFMFGDPDDPKNKHGLMGKINDIVHNLSNAVEGFIRRIGTRISVGLKKIGESLRKTINRSVERFVEGKKNNKGFGGFVARTLDRVGSISQKGIYGLADIPRNALRKHNLRKGNTVYDRDLGRNLTAAERIKLAGEYRMSGRGKGNVYDDTDVFLSGLSDEDFLGLAANTNNGGLAGYLRNEGGVKGKINETQLSQIKALIKDEAATRKKNLVILNEKRKDPSFRNLESIATNVAAMAENQGINAIPSTALKKAKIKWQDKIDVYNPNRYKQRGTEEAENNIKDLIQDYNDNMDDKDRAAKTKTVYTDYGPIQLIKNDQGEWIEDPSDKETAQSIKKRESFLDCISHIPLIGTALSNGLGWIKKKLFGEEDENGNKKSEGLIDKIKQWLNLDDEDSWILKFLGKAKSVLKNIIPATIGGVIGFGALGGLFDNLAKNIIDNLPWNRPGNGNNNNPTGVSEADDNRTVFYDENGEIDASYGSDSRFSTRLKTNLFSRLLTGLGGLGRGGSVGGKFLEWGLNSVSRLWGGKEAKLGTKLFKGFGNLTDDISGLNSTNARVAANAADNVDDVFKMVAMNLTNVMQKVFIPTIQKIMPNQYAKLVESYFGSVGKDIVRSGGSEADDLAKYLGEILAHEATYGKSGANAAKCTKWLSKAGKVCAVLTYVYIGARALQGWDTAENILGITRPATVGERWACVLISAINAAVPFVGELLTDKQIVDFGLWLAGMMGIDTSSIQADREAAVNEVNAYNEANGTLLSVEAYNRAGLGKNGKLGTGGVFTTYGEYIKTFQARKEQGGWGAAFRGIGEDISERFSEGYDQSFEEHGSAIRAVFDGVGQVMEQILPGTVGEVNQRIAEILGAAHDGDLKTVWTTTLSKFGWDNIVAKAENPAAKVLGFIAWAFGQSTLLPWKVTQTIPALFSALQNTINPDRIERNNNTANGIVKGIGLMKENWQDFLDGVESGKTIPELMKDIDDKFDDKENPLGGTMKAILNAQRIVALPSVIMGRISGQIAGKFMQIVKSVKSGAEGIKRVYDSGMRMLEDGNVNAHNFFDIEYMKEDKNNPLHGIFYAAAGVARIVSAPIFVMKKIGGTIKNIFDTVNAVTRSAMPDLKADSEILKGYMKSGDIAGLWQADLGEMNDTNPHNLLAPAMPIYNTLQKIAYTVPTVFAKAGKAIAEPFKIYFNNAKSLFSGLGDYNNTLKALADAGDISGVVSTKFDPVGAAIGSGFVDPISGIAHTVASVVKVGSMIRATFTYGSNKVADFLKSDDIVSAGKAYSRAVEALNSKEDIESVWGVKFDEYTTAQSRKSPYLGIFKFGFAFVKFGNIVKQFVKGIGGKIEEITDEINNKIADSKFAQGALKVSDFFKGLFNATSDIAARAQNEADLAEAGITTTSGHAGRNGNAGEGSRLPRGGDSGFVSQFDPRYQNYKIAGQSFGAKGCGPAVAAMAAKAMGKPMSVNQAMQYSSGYQTPEGVTLDYFQNALGSQGINTEVITGGSSQDMYSRIAAGQKMVLLGRDPSNTSKEYSPFGPNNHYVLATGVDRRGNIIINDPEAKAPKAYNPSILRSASYGIAGGGTRKARKPRRTIRNLRARFAFAGGGSNGYDTDIAQAVWSFFKARGYSEPAIAGIMGNMKSESGMNPARLQDSTPPHAAGIVQWENYAKQSGRWKAMADYAASKDRDWTDLESQLEYVEMEMNSSSATFWGDEKIMAKAGVGPTTLEAFKQSTNVEQATREFEGAFERAGVPHFEARIENAKAYYQLYAGKKTDDSALSNYTPIGSSALASMGTYGTTSGATTGATPAKKERKWTFGNLVSNTIGVFQDVLGNFFNPTTSTDAATTGYSTGYSSDVGSTGYTTGGALGSTSGVNGDMANGFPYYSQKDPAWGKLSYGNYVTASGEPATTYGAAGCGPTTAAMIMKSYNAAVGADPVSAGNFAIAKGDRPPTNSGTSGTIFPHLGEANGLLVNSISKDMVMDKLANRIPVAALMGPGDFTGGGHYVALTGTDDGHIVVNDPYSTDRTGKKWSPNVINQALSVWSIADSEGKGSIRYGKVRKGDYFYSPDGKTKITITSVAEDGTVVTSNMGINKMLNGANTFEEIQAVIDAFYGGGQVSSVNDPLAPMTEPDDGSTHVTLTHKQFSNNVLTAAGSGLVSYNDIASRAGGSSGLLLKSRVGSRSSVRASAPVRRGRTSSMPVRRIAGGDSSIADMATTYLNNAKTTVTNAGNAGTISGELVTQLLSSITALLQSIANNTAPVSQIYAALRASLQSGGGTYKEESTKITPVDNHPSGIDQTDSTVDANIKSLVGVLAQLAKG